LGEATLQAPPWKTAIDFGPDLLPHEIVARALDAKSHSEPSPRREPAVPWRDRSWRAVLGTRHGTTIAYLVVNCSFPQGKTISIAFLSLFFGLISGPYPIELAVDGPAGGAP
jgi:hypothetical protein